MINIFGIIKAHKITSAIIGGVVVASGATGATFAIINAQTPVDEQQTSRIASEAPNTEENVAPADDKTEDVELEEETKDESSQTTPSSTQTPTQPTQSSQPSGSTQNTQPVVDTKAIKQECLNKMQEWFSDIAKSSSRYNGLTAEEKVSYGSSIQYRNKVISDYESWRISSGCAEYAKSYPN